MSNYNHAHFYTLLIIAVPGLPLAPPHTYLQKKGGRAGSIKSHSILMLLLLVLTCCLGHCIAQQCPAPLNSCSCLQGNRRVSCSGNVFTSIPNIPASIRPTIVDLNLELNNIISISATDLEGLTNLVNLRLGSNLISYIEEGSFSSNTALEELDLSNNQISELPGNLFNSTQIFILDLSNNNISSLLPSVFTGLPDQATIELGSNWFQTLNQDLFINLNLFDLILTNNPIRCDCTLRWFPAFRNSLGAQQSMIGECAEPANLNGSILRLITEDQLLCNCTPSCVNGVCNKTVGECECDDGSTGTACDTPCLDGMFGANCSESCSCVEGRVQNSTCDSASGICDCLPGFSGISCEDSMEENTTTSFQDSTNATTTFTSATTEVTGSTNPTTVFKDTMESTDVDIPVYGIALLTVGTLTLIVATTILISVLIVLLKVGSTVKGQRSKIQPE